MNSAIDISINRAVLPNGLRFVHRYMPDTTMATLNVLYNTGARDENPGLTGLAHLFEHIMFGGSANVADFDAELTAAGGVSNAWTGNDFTNFFETAPAHNVETLFHIESDRMLAPSLTESTLDIQRSVVIEEFKQQCLNRPYGDMGHHLRRLVYGTHPYSWPVIGKNFEQLEHITRENVADWWTRRYSPGNAVLALAGNITWERALELANKWFADIPARPTAPRNLPAIADLEASEPHTIHGPVPATLITVAWLMDPYGTRDYFAADAITDILSDGRASRLFQQINMNPKSILVDADASITGSEHRGMLMMNGRLANEDADINEAIQMLTNQALNLAENGVTEHEMERMRNRRRSMFVLSNLDPQSAAQNIAMAEMHGVTPGYELQQMLSLTADDLRDTARRLFINSHPAVLCYRPSV